jgi:chromosomal replication initiator protein
MRAWEEFLKLQEIELGSEVVNKWLKPLKVLRFDACNLYLEAPDSFKSIWFEEHMRPRVESRLVNNNNKKIKLHLEVADKNGKDESFSKKRKKSFSKATQEFQFHFDPVVEEATFQNFLTFPSNLLAYRLLCDACSVEEKSGLPIQDRSPTASFNPIYISGPEGSGKTHLLMATANSLKGRGIHARYCRLDTFTDHVVNAIRMGEMQNFRKHYRNVDVLIVDDVDRLAKKGATQEEFFHTFNTLHVEGKQIVLSSSFTPPDLSHIEPRLVSRFEWGIVVPIQPQTKEELTKLLDTQCRRLDFPLNPDVRSFLLETFASTAKSLLRALEALMLRTHLNQGVSTPNLSVATARKYLADLISHEEKAALTPGKIIRTVADYFGIKMEDILSKSQSRECVLPRQIAMHLCRRELQIPFMKLGDIFSRDHSTVMTSVKQVEKGLEQKDQEIYHSIKGVERALTRDL